jgi:hypothetical protein
MPNGSICNISELFDYLCISYLATHQLLILNNIIPSDSHSGNIFIHWLNSNSYYGNKNIQNIEEIIYKVNKKYYKIKTFGFIIVFGDVGTYNIQIKKDVLLIGQIWNINENYKLLNERMKINHTSFDFIERNVMLLTPKELNDSICSKILNSEPYCSYPILSGKILFGKNIKYLQQQKNTVELLEFYDEKYLIKNYIKSSNNILIEAKKYNIF